MRVRGVFAYHRGLLVESMPEFVDDGLLARVTAPVGTATRGNILATFFKKQGDFDNTYNHDEWQETVGNTRRAAISRGSQPVELGGSLPLSIQRTVKIRAQNIPQETKFHKNMPHYCTHTPESYSSCRQSFNTWMVTPNSTAIIHVLL